LYVCEKRGQHIEPPGGKFENAVPPQAELRVEGRECGERSGEKGRIFQGQAERRGRRREQSTEERERRR